MDMYIKEWPNKTATLLSESGEVLWTFSTVADAEQAYREWSQPLQQNRNNLLTKNSNHSHCFVG